MPLEFSHSIRLRRELELPKPLDEWRMLSELQKISENNKQYRTFIGMGYQDCIVPGVIVRNILNNSGWTSPYTPYQPEIAQVSLRPVEQARGTFENGVFRAGLRAFSTFKR